MQGTNGNVRKLEGEKKYKERKPKCMDKDLYEVPPELIYQVRKKVIFNYILATLQIKTIYIYIYDVYYMALI